MLLIFNNGQAQSIINTKQLRWQEPMLHSVDKDNNSVQRPAMLRFERASYKLETGSLPVYSERLLLNSSPESQKPSVRLISSVYEPLPESQKALVSQNIESTLSINSWVQTERNTNYLRYEFVPIRRNPQTGIIERLVSFQPEIIWENNPEENLRKSAESTSYAEQSVLASGLWYKISVTQTGIHRILYEDLLSFGFENPENIRVFGNGGQQLPFDSSLPRPDDLTENPIFIYKGNDGIFNDGDYVLFYAEGPIHWTYNSYYKMFVHRMHQYSDEVFYFLTTDVGTGKKVQPVQAVTQTANKNISEYDFYTFREKDSLNLLHSGRLWCWKHFSIRTNWDFNITLENKITDAPVELLSSLWVRSSNTSPASKFYVEIDGQSVFSMEFPGVNTSNYEALFAATSTRKTEIITNKDAFSLAYQFAQSNPAAQGWLDYFDINTVSQLQYNNQALQFRSLESVGENSITDFTIANAHDGLLLWDVTDIGEVFSIGHSSSANSIRFKRETGELREFLLFDPLDESIPSPQSEGGFLGSIQNQDLHGLPVPDMVILVQDELRDYAQEIADIHLENDQLESLLVSPTQIYNEFSSGIQDVSAIRDFLRMLYKKGSDSDKFKYLLLFGDGSFDNKSTHFDPGLKNCLPTFQSYESLYPTSSFVTDDFFGLLDYGENLESGLLDLGIGRFPVLSPDDASIIVDKIKHYTSKETLGDWRNLLCFIGDDEDGNRHMRDANTLTEIVDSRYPTFNVDKIFLDAYQQIVTATGETYPEVNRAINDRIKKGALIMNYLGHGSEKGLAHENILSISDIRSWDNYDKLPLFMTATCEFSRFDDENISAGEWIFLNPNGGGIGLFTTTRLVYSSPNFRLNREFYDYIFEHNENGKYRFGDILRLTKNAVGSELNKLNFTLLGDPAMSLNYPEYSIKMTRINEHAVESFADTLKALSEVEVEGYMADLSGNKLSDYEGIVYPTVYDKKVTLTNLANDGGPLMEFGIQKNILFRGKSSIENGHFKFSFLVPKDIGYNVGTGKFSFYGTNGETDASGVNLQINIGGSSDSVFSDVSGPEVKLFMNDTSFVYGGITNEDPVFLAKVHDLQGINTTGNGIGHDITAIIDDNKQDIIVLNDYYESDLDNYQAGTIRYPINDLEPGTHTINLKVWDNLNNSSQSDIQFEVNSSAQLILRNLLNYPNPFTTHTDFYFEHNQAGIPLDALIQIYTVSGRLVKSFEFIESEGTQLDAGKFRVGPVSWDGLDQYGDKIGRGTYIYRVKIRTQDGARTQEAFQKLVKL